MSVSAAFVIPVFNQLDYTRQCLESLNATGVPNQDIVVVDNASTDGTKEYLAKQSGLNLISNPANLGCSTAWNQGVELASVAPWTIVMNNDVVVTAGFTEGLVKFAGQSGCDIVSPAMGEGELNYDLASVSAEVVKKLGNASRPDTSVGVCFMVHRRVFEKIGKFDTKLGQAGYEDEDFFRRARKENFKLAITGASYLHHFGSITQKSVKASLGAEARARLGNRDYFREKHGLNWFRRRADRLRERTRISNWRKQELQKAGLTLHMRRVGTTWEYH